MKYYRVNEGDASGASEFWEYFKFKEYPNMNDSDYRDEAISMFEENNSWVFELDCRRTKVQELTEQQYLTGLQFNRMYEFEHEKSEFRRKHNLYCTPAQAEMFADKSKPQVRIGYPNNHCVYKINPDGNFIFVYHYCSDRLGKLC